MCLLFERNTNYYLCKLVYALIMDTHTKTNTDYYLKVQCLARDYCH